jgi:hypothetical protein
MWGHLKSSIYAKKPVDIPELKPMITDEIQVITSDMLKNVMNQMFNMASVPCLYPQGLALYDLSNTGKDLTLTLYRVRVSY